MRLSRWVMLGIASGSVVACGMIAGVDSYEAGDLTAGLDASEQIDATTGVSPETDSSTATRVDSGATDLDAGTLTEPDTSFDAYTAPPPPLTDGCPGSGENGQSCVAASTCCSTFCTEQRKCEGSCKEYNQGCSKGQCCIGFYCTLDIGSNSCAECVTKGNQPPTDYSNFPPTAYNEACCSGNSTLHFDSKGNPYATCN